MTTPYRPGASPAGGQEVGDMPPEEFRRNGHKVVDWIADYLGGVGSYPVVPPISPGQIRESLPASAPSRGEPFEDRRLPRPNQIEVRIRRRAAPQVRPL